MSLSIAVTHRGLRTALTGRIGLVLFGSAMLALSARLVLPVPASPVLVTAQTLAVVLSGALLGPELAVASVGLYLLAGVSGLPVFSAGGGAPYLLGPTGGFLLGFIPACWIMGSLVQRGWHKSPALLALAILLSLSAIYGLGLLVLSDWNFFCT